MERIMDAKGIAIKKKEKRRRRRRRRRKNRYSNQKFKTHIEKQYS
jgi:hypothetical protein